MEMSSNQNRFDSIFYRTILEQLNTYVCITDPETDRILYMNQAMKNAFHVEHPEGIPCWQVLQEGMEGRCRFCRKWSLSERRPVCIWENMNTRNNCVYKNYDSLVRVDGKLYHVQSCVDVTEYAGLSHAAGLDEMTGVLNRRAGKERLASLVEEARREQKILTVVLYDINELKRINDAYGHREGDRLLRYVTKTANQCLRARDLIFRLSGDEFVLAFYGEQAAQADARVQKVLQRLGAEREQFSIFYDASFSYGLTEVYPEDGCSVSEILEQADGQMYLHKRDYRINQAKRQLMDSGSRGDQLANFRYDKEHLYDALIASTDDYIFIGNMKTGTFRYPPAMVREFGLPGEVVENAAAVWGALIHPNDERGFLESNQEVADGRVASHNIDYRARNAAGEWIWLRCRGRMIRDREGKPELFAGMITNLGKKNQIDHMTGLYNRFEFEGAVKKHLADGGEDTRMGIMILDMDAFKNINDLYDRSFGDEVLRMTGQKISSLLPSNAGLYRMDGDEFAVLILNGEPDEHVQIFNSIRHRLRRRQEYEGKKYFATISAGYASYPKDADNYLDLLKCANYSLEHSKLRGKNRMTSFSPLILEGKERRLELTELLRESIDRGFIGFSVSYQPQVSTQTGELYGAEALARWQCDKYGNVPPGEFIPLLEQSGLIIQLGGWVFCQAARQCKLWRRRKPEFRMSVNVSYLQFLQGDIVSFVRQTLKEFALPPENMTLELTETYLLKEDALTGDILERLRGIGIKLAMDDFGMGYSSLISLKNVPVDFVKIDRGFVKGITTDLFNATFVKAITELCHNVGKEVCLEGVETEEEYCVVKDTGMELIQGFYFGRPVSAEVFAREWLGA